MPKFKLKYDDLKNIKTDSVNTFVLNLHQIKQLKFFFGTPGMSFDKKSRDHVIFIVIEWLNQKLWRIKWNFGLF